MTYRYRQVIEEGGGLTYLRSKYKLTPSELFVLDNLIKHDHPQKGCFPRQSIIAKETGLHRTNVVRAIEGLVRKGLLESHKPKYYRDHIGKLRQNKINRYRFSDAVGYACHLAYEQWRAEAEPEPEFVEEDEVSTLVEYFEQAGHNSGHGHDTIADMESHNSGHGRDTMADTGDHNSGHDRDTIADTRSSNESKKEEEGKKTERSESVKDSRTAAAGAADLSINPFAEGAVSEQRQLPNLYEQAKSTEGVEHQAASARAHGIDPATEAKLCQCGAEIPPEKAAAGRDKCLDCYAKEKSRHQPDHYYQKIRCAVTGEVAVELARAFKALGLGEPVRLTHKRDEACAVLEQALKKAARLRRTVPLPRGGAFSVDIPESALCLPELTEAPPNPTQ